VGLSHPLTTFEYMVQRAFLQPLRPLGCEPPVEEVRNGELGVASERAVEHRAQDRGKVLLCVLLQVEGLAVLLALPGRRSIVVQ